MSTLVVVLAFALLVLGVVGSFVPVLPGPLLSLAGVLAYWWATGYTDPGTAVLFVLLFIGILAVVVDLLAGYLAAKVGGASTLTAVVAGAVGLLGILVLGPLGVILGIAGTVFVLEVVRHGDLRKGGRTAFVSTVGVLASSVVQALLTASMLLTVLVVHLL